MASSGSMTGSGEEVRADSNQSGHSNQSGDSSSATSGGSGGKKKKGNKAQSLRVFLGPRAADPQPRQARTSIADRNARQTQARPNLASAGEFPLLSGSSSGQQIVDAAADPPESDRAADLLPRDQLMEEAAHLPPGEQLMSVSSSELARLRAADAELARLKARDDLMEELAREGITELKAQTNVLQKQFAHLLQTYKMKGPISYYGCRALQMIPSKNFDFIVDFKHVLDQGYLDLAVNIVKEIKAHHGTGWLLKTTLDFLKTQRLLDRNNLLAVILEFDNVPESMKPFSEYDAQDLMQRDMSPLGLEHNLLSAIFVGRQIYIGAQQHVLDQHDNGKTWGGQFEQEDIYVILFSRTSILCWIRGSDKNLPCNAKNKVLDLKKLHQSMVSKYQIDGHYPAHFKCLQTDMNNLNAASIDESAVLEYLPYHLALMPHGAIKFLTGALYDATEGVWMSQEDFNIYKAVFEAPPTGENDWRIKYCNSEDPLVRGVYHHDNRSIQEILKNNTDLENMTSAEVQGNMRSAEVKGSMRSAAVLGSTRSAEVQGNMRSAEVKGNMRSAAVQGSVRSAEVQGDMSSGEGTSDGSVRTKFQRTRKSKLNFKRHLDVHLHSHIAGKRPLSGLFQGEVYSSTKNDILGDIFSELFKGPTMKLKTYLRPLMKLYRGMRDIQDDDDLPTDEAVPRNERYSG